MARTILTGASIFDGTGARPARADVVVEDGRIIDVGLGLDGDRRISLEGRAILPGLFDCHVHVMVSHMDELRRIHTPFSYAFFEAARNLEATLAAGITTVRDAGGADLGLKQAADDRLVRGPRLQISLSMISQTGGHGDGWTASGDTLHFFQRHPGLPDTLVDGPDEMRRVVRTLVRHGADVIKVATSGGVMSPRDLPTHAHFRPSELEALVEEATAAGIGVMAHAQGVEGIKNAIRAGIRSIEHGIYLDDEAISLMLERRTWLVPTLVAPRGVIRAAEAGAAIPNAQVAKAREVVEAHADSFRRAVAAGVRVAMGTDSGVTPHGENLEELTLMVAGGMTPAAALEATTQSAAQLMGLDDELGTLEPGKRADLVLIDGDPLEVGDLRRRVRAVFRDGEQVTGEALPVE